MAGDAHDAISSFKAHAAHRSANKRLFDLAGCENMFVGIVDVDDAPTQRHSHSRKQIDCADQDHDDSAGRHICRVVIRPSARERGPLISDTDGQMQNLAPSAAAFFLHAPGSGKVQ